LLDEKMKERVSRIRENGSDVFQPMMIQNGFVNAPEGLKRPPMKIDVLETVNATTKIYKAHGDPLFGNKLLILSGRLDSGHFIELKIPILSIQKSIMISNQFMLICGLIVFAIAMGYAYILSTFFTSPIREMNAVTKSLKNHDFSQACEVKSTDEIGELAVSINDMSATLSKTIQSLNSKNEQLETLINDVSHELKTPLALLQGYAEGLQQNILTDKEKMLFYTEVISDEAKKMNRIVERLLNIHQLESGEKQLFMKEFSLTTLIDDIIAKYQPVLGKKDLTIIFQPSENVRISGDAFYMEQVITNYLTNAIEYVDDRKVIEIKQECDHEVCKIEIYNTTDEIPDEEINSIWDKFHKLDRARSRDKGGHGLGLSIVKAIHEQHHHEFGVRNDEEGITFWFNINRI